MVPASVMVTGHPRGKGRSDLQMQFYCVGIFFFLTALHFSSSKTSRHLACVNLAVHCSFIGEVSGEYYHPVLQM